MTVFSMNYQSIPFSTYLWLDSKRIKLLKCFCILDKQGSFLVCLILSIFKQILIYQLLFNLLIASITAECISMLACIWLVLQVLSKLKKRSKFPLHSSSTNPFKCFNEFAYSSVIRLKVKQSLISDKSN